MRHRGRFRFQLAICIPTILAGLMEYADPHGIGSKMDPESSIPVWQELYPDDAESLRTRARDDIQTGRFTEARELLETAIATNDKTNEDLLYDYIILLGAMQADAADVTAAVKNWKRNFPHSERPDPTSPSSLRDRRH